jgi:DNA polymerase-3 subunit alpha
MDDYKLEVENFTSKEFSLKDLNNNIESMKGRDLTFAGMVTESIEAVGKTGKHYCKMTLTDYTDSYTFFFFGKDYVEFSKYSKTGLFLMVKGQVQPRYNGDQLEFKVRSIELLSEVRKNNIQSVTLQLPLQAVTPELVHEIEAVSLKNKGKALLRFNIWDPETKTMVNLFSRNTRVEMTNDLERFFRDHESLTFKIN